MINPIAFAVSINLDILYMHQAMCEPDWNKFIETMTTEIQGHEQMGNFIPVPLLCIPTKLIDMVWLMHCKHWIKTQEIYKWKACLNVQGGGGRGQQDYTIHYWESYTPIGTWQMVHFFLILSIVFGLADNSTSSWHTHRCQHKCLCT